MYIRSKKEFAKLSAFDKGYSVYCVGAWKEEPHVPKSYKPTTKKDRAWYKRGAARAARDAQDGEE